MAHLHRLRTKLNEAVRKIYGDIDCPKCPENDPMCDSSPSYYQRFTEAKEKLGDTTKLLDASLPLSLLKKFGISDCLECWLCLNVGEYEFVPVFIYTQAYLYVFDRETDNIKVLSLNQTLFSYTADILSLETASVDHTKIVKNFGWKKDTLRRFTE